MPSRVFFRIKAIFIGDPYYVTIMNKLIQYLKETKNELKEVVFPTSSQTITYTVLVIVISIVVAVTLGGVDLSLRTVLKKIVNAQSDTSTLHSSSTGSEATATPITR